MIQEVIFIDGPKKGAVYTLIPPLRDIDELVVAISKPPVKTLLSALIKSRIRMGIYRACRIPSSGHIVHDSEQRLVYRYQGERR